ncbi:MotA/TolQ/ExbB proton channel family protein, partial [bacterium]|nr:MotA/TolQ/ExbB proton channel family protein [bacterium]
MMDFGPIANIADFISNGGIILFVLLIVAAVLWYLIIERLFFVFVKYPKVKQVALQRWDHRSDHSSWFAKGVRSMLISETSKSIAKSVLTIKTLVALCPMIGLLGTVYGMIQVFDVMALEGTRNARSIASGVYTS